MNVPFFSTRYFLYLLSLLDYVGSLHLVIVLNATSSHDSYLNFKVLN